MMKITVLTTCALLLIGVGPGALKTRLERMAAQEVKIEPGAKTTPKPAKPTPTSRKPVVNRTPRRDAQEIELVRISGGSFRMGSPDNEPGRGSDEGPRHRVTMPSFYIGKYEVTQRQWRKVAGLPKVSIDLESDPDIFEGGDLPVVRVSYWEAREFCARLSRETGRGYRLPNEAEWEYAARAKTTTPFAFGSSLSSEQANFNGNYPYGGAPAGVSREKATPVGSFAPNAFGIHDMHGNVGEWCEDVYHGSYDGAPTVGSAWLSGGDPSLRVVRGGSWNHYGRGCRSASRDGGEKPEHRFRMVGFRIVVSGSALHGRSRRE